MVMLKDVHGAKLKTKKQALKFTKGTSPFEQDVLKFVLSENV